MFKTMMEHSLSAAIYLSIKRIQTLSHVVVLRDADLGKKSLIFSQVY
jgi:hypothetical protein